MKELRPIGEAMQIRLPSMGRGWTAKLARVVMIANELLAKPHPVPPRKQGAAYPCAPELLAQGDRHGFP